MVRRVSNLCPDPAVGRAPASQSGGRPGLPPSRGKASLSWASESTSGTQMVGWDDLHDASHFNQNVYYAKASPDSYPRSCLSQKKTQKCYPGQDEEGEKSPEKPGLPFPPSSSSAPWMAVAQRGAPGEGNPPFPSSFHFKPPSLGCSSGFCSFQEIVIHRACFFAKCNYQRPCVDRKSVV